MPRVLTGHLQTYYQDIGKHRPVILVLHGWGHSWEAWSGLIPVLSQKYRLLIPDLPGFGQSDSSPDGWNMYQYSVWLKSFLEAVGVEELQAVVGHSFGGKLASFAWMGYADQLNLPPVKTALGLVNASGIPLPQSMLKTTLTRVLAHIPRTIKRQWLGTGRRWLYESILGETDYLQASTFQELTLNKILPEDIRQVVRPPHPLPLRIIWGEKDTAVPVWMAYQFAHLSSDSLVAVIPDGTHYLPQQNTQTIVDWLETWL